MQARLALHDNPDPRLAKRGDYHQDRRALQLRQHLGQLISRRLSAKHHARVKAALYGVIRRLDLTGAGGRQVIPAGEQGG